MKKHLLILTVVLTLTVAHGQTTTDSLCTDFETSASFIEIQDTLSIWQIGIPNKTYFNSSYSPVHSIVTDTINTYPASDSSIFYSVYNPAFVVNYLGIYFPFQIEFRHRFETDSLFDFGSIAISTDGGNNWMNGLTNEYCYNCNQQDMTNSHIFETTGDTLYDSLSVTGKSGGWIHSTITKDIYYWQMHLGIWTIDSIIVKFTFQSDSINNNNDGWQIDDLCIKYLIPFGLSVEENQKINSMKISPNPFSSQTVLRTDNLLRSATLSVDNCFGQTVQQIKNISGQTVVLSRDNLASGLYFVRLTEENKTIAVDKLVITNN